MLLSLPLSLSSKSNVKINVDLFVQRPLNAARGGRGKLHRLEKKDFNVHPYFVLVMFCFPYLLLVIFSIFTSGHV